MTKATDNLTAAAAEYALAEAMWLSHEGARTGPDHEAKVTAWQAATVNLAKAAKVAGREKLHRLGQTVARVGASVGRKAVAA